MSSLLAGRWSTSTIGGLALLIMVVVATAAAAQSSESADVQLNMSVNGEGTRSLSVTDVLGNPLEELELNPGEGANYRATVTDLDYLVGQGFNVVTETGNLYPVTGSNPTVVDTDAHQVDSADVAVNLTQGLTTDGVLADLQPTYLLSVLGGLTDCAATLGSLEAVVGAGILPTQVQEICTAVDGVSDTAESLPILGDVIADLDLDSLVGDVLGLSDGIAESTPFTNPSFLGLGAADSDATGAPDATQVSLMLAQSPTGVTDDLLAAIQGVLPSAAAQPLTEVIDTASAVQALVNAGAETGYQAVGNAIADIDDQVAQEAIVNTVLELVDAPVDLSFLSNLVGSYTAYPVLTATPAPGTPSDAYAGTHTVTLISQ